MHCVPVLSVPPSENSATNTCQKAPRSMKRHRCARHISAALRLLFCTVPVFCQVVYADAANVIDVGDRKQIFLDGLFLESQSGVEIVMHKPHRDGQVLIAPDKPWEREPHGIEQRIGLYSSVLKENGRVRIWYDMERGELSPEIRVGYAESEDGIHFTKPNLGLHEVDGSRANNVVISGDRLAGAAVWVDPRAPQQHRYKTQTKVYPSGQLLMHSSPDGIHWNPFLNLRMGHIDTQNIIFWDPDFRRYLLYTRLWKDNENKPLRFRTVRRLESDDLKTWDSEQVVLEPDERDYGIHEKSQPRTCVDFYGGGIFRYEEADRAYIMFAQSTWAWMDWDEAGLGPATIDVQLAVSRDSKEFRRVGDRSAFLSLGPEGRFDSRFIWAMPNPIRMGDEIWIYYVASNRDHTPSNKVDKNADQEMSGIGRATLRLDGWTSVDAGYDAGQFTTPPLTFSGDTLQLNVDAAGGGAVKVELLDQSGAPIPGFAKADARPIARNSVRMPVSWKGNPDLKALAGKPVRIRFHITNASLYAFQFLNGK